MSEGLEQRKFKDGEPCGHPGCLSHVSHPCEGCGRIAGRPAPTPEIGEWGCGWEHWIDVFSEGKIQWDEKEALKQYIRSLLAAKTEEVLEHYYNAPCSGCPEGHPSFWKTITESEEWKEWSNVAKYDMPECGECGFISKKHWHDFIKFIIARPVVSRLEIEENRGRRNERKLESS